MNKQVFLLTVTSIAFITVWTTFFLSIFDKDKEEVAVVSQEKKEFLIKEKEIKHLPKMKLDEIEMKNEPDLSRKENRMNYSVRGIHEGDFDHIAKDKVISIKELLERIDK